ncbi:PucR family transcriptional regulator [Dactylosporangium cerinum]|uniref:PucR family transcriptional regulator n=1 Tax=Dactylosporangium cerinum TaxID=1434730 RepID=A0ABV9VQ23_9ACTN
MLAQGRSLTGGQGRGLTVGVETAVDAFVDTFVAGGDLTRTRAVFHELGRTEYREGHRIDALRSVLTVGGRAIWSAVSDPDSTLDRADLSAVAHALFGYVDVLAGAAAEGYLDEQQEAAHDWALLRRRLITLLVQPDPPADAALHAAAEAARWPLPASVTVVSVEGTDAEHLARAVGAGAIATVIDGATSIVVPSTATSATGATGPGSGSGTGLAGAGPSSGATSSGPGTALTGARPGSGTGATGARAGGTTSAATGAGTAGVVAGTTGAGIGAGVSPTGAEASATGAEVGTTRAMGAGTTGAGLGPAGAGTGAPGARGPSGALVRGLTGRRAAVGPELDLRRARTSHRLSRRALQLQQAGTLPDGVISCDDHLVALVTAWEPGVADRLTARALAPLATATPASREVLAETLLAWLRCQGQVIATAEALHTHPQTVRYRLRKLRDAYGARLDDPDERLALHLGLL